MSKLTIVMYHYVRELIHTAYPGIKGRSVDEFRGQLAYLKKNFTLIGYDHLRAALNEGEKLPENACLLTFDDGYLDHYLHVFPLLDEQGVQGMFFPPAAVIEERRILNVNKIHYILACEPGTGKLVTQVKAWIAEHSGAHSLKPFDDYWNEWAVADDYDPADVIFIKRILQVGLPEVLRSKIIDELFKNFVSSDELAFAEQLYMTKEQLRTLIRAGHYVGNHGWDHDWLNSLPPEGQAREVDRALGFLDKIGAPTQDWIMGYPYGGWNEGLLDLLKTRNCICGMTTVEETADLNIHDTMLLPRLDTNRFPISVT